MKLLRIERLGNEGKPEHAIVFVPDEYDKDKVLRDANELYGNSRIADEIEIASTSGRSPLDEIVDTYYLYSA